MTAPSLTPKNDSPTPAPRESVGKRIYSFLLDPEVKGNLQGPIESFIALLILLNVGLMLTGNHAKAFNDNVKAIAASAKGAGADVNGWGLIQSGFNFQLGSAEKAAQAMAISFGTALLPAATKVMKIFAEFGSWLSKHTAASKALAVVVGILLAGALEHGLYSSC